MIRKRGPSVGIGLFASPTFNRFRTLILEPNHLHEFMPKPEQLTFVPYAIEFFRLEALMITTRRFKKVAKSLRELRRSRPRTQKGRPHQSKEGPAAERRHWQQYLRLNSMTVSQNPPFRHRRGTPLPRRMRMEWPPVPGIVSLIQFGRNERPALNKWILSRRADSLTTSPRISR